MLLSLMDAVQVTAKDLTVYLGEQKVLDSFSCTILEHQITTISGPNGSGKTTFLRTLAGLTTLKGGEINFTADHLRSIAYLPQQFDSLLHPWRSARENILYPLRIKKITDAECSVRLEKLLQKFPISFSLDRFPYQLSGGQRQYTAFLMCLIREPSLLLLDEPFSALDAQTKEHLTLTLPSFVKQSKITAVLVTHI